MPKDAERFAIAVGDAELADLDRRLAATRLPVSWTDDPDLGMSPHYLAELVGWWRETYDWREAERGLNELAHFRSEVDGVRLHYVLERSPSGGGVPVLLVHGWPSTFVEMLPLLARLRDPRRFGLEPAIGCDVVAVSLPGYGFSDPLPGSAGASDVPRLLNRLMTEVLGYDRYVAHGGDIGGMVVNRLGLEFPDRLLGVHTVTVAEPHAGDLSREEADFLRFRARDIERNGGYSHEQRTRPVTLAHGLNDSPAGLAAWIVEKFRDWGDCGRDVESRFTRDTLITTASIYWHTRTIGSSFRMYYDWKLGSPGQPDAWDDAGTVAAGVDSRPLPPGTTIDVPVAVALFGRHCPLSWAERAYSDLIRWTEMPRGGHFPALEEPDLLARDLLETVAELLR